MNFVKKIYKCSTRIDFLDEEMLFILFIFLLFINKIKCSKSSKFTYNTCLYEFSLTSLLANKLQLHLRQNQGFAQTSAYQENPKKTENKVFWSRSVGLFNS